MDTSTSAGNVATIAGAIVLTIKATQVAIGAGRSTVYRLIQEGSLETVEVPGVGPRVTAASILRHLGMMAPLGAPIPTPPADGQVQRRRGRPRAPRGHYIAGGEQQAA